MTLQELHIPTASVCVNVERGALVDTDTLTAQEARERYGDLRVLSYAEPRDVTARNAQVIVVLESAASGAEGA